VFQNDYISGDENFFGYSLVIEKKQPVNITLPSPELLVTKSSLPKYTDFSSILSEIDSQVQQHFTAGKCAFHQQMPDGTRFYKVTGSRYCHIKGGEHKTHNIYIAVNTKKHILQMCHSFKCRGKAFLLHIIDNKPQNIIDENVWETLSEGTLNEMTEMAEMVEMAEMERNNELKDKNVWETLSEGTLNEMTEMVEMAEMERNNEFKDCGPL
jgi:hypothetical protein